MKKSSLYIAFGFACMLGILQAQTPGYVGKRFILSGGITVAPAILYGVEEGLWGPNIKLKVEAEWVANKRLSVMYGGWGLNTRARYANDQLESGFASISAWGGQVGLRFYHYNRTGVPAPVGAFHELGIGYVSYSLEDIDGIYRQNGQLSFGPYSDWNMYYRLGTRYIIRDWFSWEIALELGTLASLPQTNFRSQVSPAILGRARLIRHMALGVHIGAGVVIGGRKQSSSQTIK